MLTVIYMESVHRFTTLNISGFDSYVDFYIDFLLFGYKTEYTYGMGNIYVNSYVMYKVINLNI